MTELLIVIAVIFILLSMLLPALGKAREAAYSSVCKGNLRQIITAFHQYYGDYDYSHYVFWSVPGSSSNIHWSWLGKYSEYRANYLRIGKRPRTAPITGRRSCTVPPAGKSR